MKAVNLIPNDQRRAQASGAKPGSAYIVIGVLATLLVMVAGYVVTSNKVTEDKNAAADAKAEAAQLEAEVAQRGSFTNFSQIKETRLASVSGVAATRFDWERFMRELSRVMPGGSWLQSADASVTGEVAGAEQDTAAGTAVAVEPKANLVGCTPQQSDVAAMMVRLRELHRVSDVELNESTTELGAQASDAGVEGCGRYYKFDLLVTFSPTPPEAEAPVGEAVVPASLGGGS